MSNAITVVKETVRGIVPGTGPAHGWTPVGLTEVQLVVSNLSPIYKAVLVIADPDNTVNVFIGRKGVTNDKNIDLGGFPLEPGRSIPIPIDDATVLYVIAAAAGQNVAWMYI